MRSFHVIHLIWRHSSIVLCPLALLLLVGCTSANVATSTTPVPGRRTVSDPSASSTVSATPFAGIYNGHAAGVVAVAWSPDGKLLASASDDHTVQVWSPVTGQTLVTYDGHSSYVFSVAWSPSGAHIASAGNDGTIHIWEAHTGKQLVHCTGMTGPIYGVAWSPDGMRVVAGSEDGRVMIWNASNGRVLLTYSGHRAGVRQVAWSPDGRYIASASQDGTVQVWDAENGQRRQIMGDHKTPVWAVAWSPDSKRIASATGNNDGNKALDRVSVWDMSSGQTLLAYKGHGASLVTWGDGIFGVAWSPDGKRIASGGADGTVQVWSATTGQRIGQNKQQTSVVWSVAWSPDGQQVASASQDATVVLWKL